jgi:5'-nucleotidase
MSLASGFDRSGRTKWETPVHHGPALVRSLLSADWPAGVYMNVNFPDRDPGDVAGMQVTVQGRRDQNLLRIDKRSDTWGNPYFWLGFERRRSNPAEGTDLAAVYAGHISITPLDINLTDRATCETLAAHLARR